MFASSPPWALCLDFPAVHQGATGVLSGCESSVQADITVVVGKCPFAHGDLHFSGRKPLGVHLVEKDLGRLGLSSEMLGSQGRGGRPIHIAGVRKVLPCHSQDRLDLGYFIISRLIYHGEVGKCCLRQCLCLVSRIRAVFLVEWYGYCGESVSVENYDVFKFFFK